MISCEYIGRLGNNMFQIAAAASLALRNQDVFEGQNWSYRNVFNFADNIVFCGRKIEAPKMAEEGFHYNELFYKPNMQLYGYFQSEKYFDKEYIKKVFTLKDEFKDPSLDKYKDILCMNTVSYHIRRTDYLQVQHQHPVQPLEYFAKATEEIEKTSPVDKIVVFSDDIAYCKQNFTDSRCVFIEGERDFIDMFIMSRCQHNIISNSSFSWWGAWLNPNPHKVVIAPKNWFGEHYAHLDTKDVYAEGWIAL